MKESALTLEPELRVSPKLAAAILMALGLVLVFVSETQIDAVERSRTLVFSLVFYAMAATTWLLNLRPSWVGQWFAITALFVMINLGHSWFGAWEFVSLVIVPIALAGATIGWAAAFAVAVGETVWLVLRSQMAVWSMGQNTLLIPLVAVWVMAIMMHAVYRSISLRNQWMWDYFERTRDQLEEARERRMELEQVLEDLGHANRQLALSAERMTALRLIAQGAQEAKSRFVARVSHEFRAPLNMII